MNRPDASPLAGRVGILGGTFNPVHIGHLRLALEAREALDLRQVELMPCALPPHKPPKGLLPFALRVRLLRAAVEAIPGLAVSTLEGELPPPSYTWNLVQAWSKRAGEPPLFLLGDEDFACLDSWRHGTDLPRLTDLIVVPRSGTDTDLFCATVARVWPDAPLQTLPACPGCLQATLVPGRRCLFLPLRRLEISASQIRAAWAAKRDLHFLVPEPVRRILETERRAFSAWE